MVKPENCQHQNILWEDFFKEPKSNNAYCVDCGIIKGEKFAYKLQRWYAKKVKKWLEENNLTEKSTDHQGAEIHTYLEFENFLEKNNYKEQWNKLNYGTIASNHFEGLTGQGVFFEYTKSIEQLLQEFKKEKQKPDDQENQINQLKQRIKELEQKTSRTPQEEQELKEKQAELERLEKDQSNEGNDKNNWIKPALIIGSITIAVIGVLWLLNKNKKRSNY